MTYVQWHQRQRSSKKTKTRNLHNHHRRCPWNYEEASETTKSIQKKTKASLDRGGEGLKDDTNDN
jgi:hypothetical protein